MLRQSLCLFVSLLLFAAVAAGGETEGHAWLAAPASLHTERNYEGVVAYQVGDTFGSFRIIHSIVDGRPFELLEPLDSAGSELLRRGHSIKCVYPSEKLIRAMLGEQGEQDELDELARYYELVLGGAVRIAGREGVRLTIKPRDPYRLGYRLALDRETALPLKSEMIDSQGRAVERFQFTIVEFNGEPMAERDLSQAREVRRNELLSHARSQEIQQQLAWRPGWVPEGFRLIREPDNESVEALSYSDGLAVFSIFVESAAGNGGTSSEPMRRGASVAYSHLAGGDLRVTVVGEVPVITAQQVAQSVEFTGGP